MRWDNFTGGLWLPEGVHFAIPENSLLAADNVEPLPSGGLRGRRGYTAYITTATAGLSGEITFLWRHYPRGTAAASFLAAYDDGTSVTLVADPTGTGNFSTTLTTSWTTANRIYAAYWPQKDATFLANGADGLFKYDGTNLSTVSASSIAVTGPYITVWKGRLWATRQDELNFSLYASDVNDETNFPAGNMLNLSDPQGGDITGVVGYSDSLIILKETNLWRFFGDITFEGQLTRYSEHGCVAPLSVALTPYGVIYLARDGVRLTDGMSPEGIELSKPIRSLFVSRGEQTVYPNAVGVWHPRNNAYYITLEPTGTVGYVMYALETVNRQVVFTWTRHDSLYLNAAAVWDSETDEGQLFTGDRDGMVWEYNRGNDDNGSPIISRIQTPSRPFSNDKRLGRAVYVRSLYRSDGTLSVGLRYDNNTSGNDVSVTLGSTGSVRVQNARSPVPDQGQHGQYLSLHVSASGGYELEIHQLETEDRVRPSARRAWRHD